jgi:hypothetical protein
MAEEDSKIVAPYAFYGNELRYTPPLFKEKEAATNNPSMPSTTLSLAPLSTSLLLD